jgi:hypothetical protein
MTQSQQHCEVDFCQKNNWRQIDTKGNVDNNSTTIQTTGGNDDVL